MQQSNEHNIGYINRQLHGTNKSNFISKVLFQISESFSLLCHRNTMHAIADQQWQDSKENVMKEALQT